MQGSPWASTMSQFVIFYLFQRQKLPVGDFLGALCFVYFNDGEFVSNRYSLQLNNCIYTWSELIEHNEFTTETNQMLLDQVTVTHNTCQLDIKTILSQSKLLSSGQRSTQSWPCHSMCMWLHTSFTALLNHMIDSKTDLPYNNKLNLFLVGKISKQIEWRFPKSNYVITEGIKSENSDIQHEYKENKRYKM